MPKLSPNPGAKIGKVNLKNLRKRREKSPNNYPTKGRAHPLGPNRVKIRILK